MPITKGNYDSSQRKSGQIATSNLLNYYMNRIRNKSLELSEQGIAEFAIPIKEIKCSIGMLTTLLTLDKYKTIVTEQSLTVCWK